MKKYLLFDAENTVALIIVLFCILYMVAAWVSLGEVSRQMPLLTGGVTVLLVVFSILSRSIRGNRTPSDEHPDAMIEVPLAREFAGILYVVVLLLGIYLVGFYVAIPVYVFLSIGFLGHQSLKAAVLAASSALMAIYLMFDLALEYPLFTGIMLS